MSDQSSLFDPSAAREARDGGISLAETNADEIWKREAMSAIRFLARMRPRFTADDVWERLHITGCEVITHQPSALGPLFMRAAKEGLIRNTHMTVPTKIPRRHREITVWASVRADDDE